MVLLGLEPEDEAATLFLRLRKAARRGRTQVVSVASYASRGLTKMNGRLVPAAPGTEVEVIGSLKDAEHGVTKDAVILVGERLAQTHGALSAAARPRGRAPAPASPGCRDVPVTAARSRPARCPTCCPADVRVTEASARVDLGAAWGVESLPGQGRP